MQTNSGGRFILWMEKLEIWGLMYVFLSFLSFFSSWLYIF